MNPDGEPRSFYPIPEATPERQQFYRRLNASHAAPLWEAMGKLIPPGPEPAAQSAIWRYREIRPLLKEAGDLLPSGETERRVLMLENPGLPGQSLITQSLYAGVQLVLPGEVAPSHRHVTAALRLVFESNGAYTTVDGQRMKMEPGDFILTPSWTFHEHGNPGSEPAVWVDCLDLPIVNLFNTSFAEHDPGGTSDRAVTGTEGLHYRYVDTRESLEELRRRGPTDPCHGITLLLQNPEARPAINTIRTCLQLLPAGFRSEAYRSTDSKVICVIEGQGETRIGATVLEWEKHDVFAVPAWCLTAHSSSNEDSVLCCFSDRPAQEALGLWREEVLGS